jgi:hypothetical protein
MRRARPARTASATSASPPISPSGWSVRGWTISTYSGSRSGSLRQEASDLPDEDLGDALAVEVEARRRLQRPEERRGRPSLLGTEVAVPTAHGQPVLLPHDRKDPDVHLEVQVLDHPAHDDGLLGVLLAEIGGVRTAQVEQLQDDRGDAAEVIRPGAAAEETAQPGDLDVGGVPLRVHLLDGRQEQHVDVDAPGHLLVRVDVAGIATQVLVGRELRRVDEHADHDLVAIVAGGPHQAEVPLVERAHRGDQAHAEAVLPHDVEVLGQLPPRLDHSHSTSSGRDRRRSLHRSRTDRDSVGCSTSGAISASGSRTNARSARRGWGTSNPGSRATRSS